MSIRKLQIVENKTAREQPRKLTIQQCDELVLEGLLRLMIDDNDCLPLDAAFICSLWPSRLSKPTPTTIESSIVRLLNDKKLRRFLVGHAWHLAKPKPEAETVHELAKQSPGFISLVKPESRSVDQKSQSIEPVENVIELKNRKRSPTPAEPKALPKTSETPSAPVSLDHHALFELQLETDVEREKILMYRIFIMIELVGVMLLLRQLMLWGMP